MFVKALVPTLALFTSSIRAAKTDLAGCSLTVVPLLTEIVTVTATDGALSSYGNYGYTTFQWDGTEQCQLLDCGGGRAPPKTNAPGCPLYSGTDTVPSLPFPTASLTLNAAAASTTAPAATSSGAAATATPAATSSSPLATNTGSSATPSGTPSSSNTGASATSGTPSSSGTAAAPSNNGQRSGRSRMLMGLAAVAAAALSFA